MLRLRAPTYVLLSENVGKLQTTCPLAQHCKTTMDNVLPVLLACAECPVNSVGLPQIIEQPDEAERSIQMFMKEMAAARFFLLCQATLTRDWEVVHAAQRLPSQARPVLTPTFLCCQAAEVLTIRTVSYHAAKVRGNCWMLQPAQSSCWIQKCRSRLLQSWKPLLPRKHCAARLCRTEASRSNLSNVAHPSCETQQHAKLAKLAFSTASFKTVRASSLTSFSATSCPCDRLGT